MDPWWFSGFFGPPKHMSAKKGSYALMDPYFQTSLGPSKHMRFLQQKWKHIWLVHPNWQKSNRDWQSESPESQKSWSSHTSSPSTTVHHPKSCSNGHKEESNLGPHYTFQTHTQWVRVVFWRSVLCHCHASKYVLPWFLQAVSLTGTSLVWLAAAL